MPATGKSVPQGENPVKQAQKATNDLPAGWFARPASLADCLWIAACRTQTGASAAPPSAESNTHSRNYRRQNCRYGVWPDGNVGRTADGRVHNNDVRHRYERRRSADQLE